MTFDDAANVLDALTCAYPTWKATDYTIETWIEAIHDTSDDADHALLVARRWARSHERVPSMAEFLNAIRPALPSGPRPASVPRGMDPEPVDADAPVGAHPRVVARIRAQLAAGRAREHNHHGPQPCPVCGGVRPERESA